MSSLKECLDFSGDGKVVQAIGPYDNFSRAIAVQSDDKIVTAGLAEYTGYGYDWSLVRYNTNGTVDTGFNGNTEVNSILTASPSAGNVRTAWSYRDDFTPRSAHSHRNCGRSTAKR